MTQFLKNIQNKPEHIKRLIMWSGIFFAMAAIFTFWIWTFPSQITATPENDRANNIKKELPDIWQSLKGQLNELKSLWPK